ncbi:hypothetical protein ACFE04_022372 [Oxalis oulophora]
MENQEIEKKLETIFRASHNPLIAHDLDQTFDWRSHPNMLAPVIDQQKCNCCWCIVCSCTISSIRKINGHDKDLILYSHQQLLDCTPHPHPETIEFDKVHCFPYKYKRAFAWCRDNGLATLKDYPFIYTTDRVCRMNVPRTQNIIEGYGTIPIDGIAEEEALLRKIT